MAESRRRLTDHSTGTATLVAQGCSFTGHVSTNGDFHVSGTIDGDCDVKGAVTLTDKGRWQGTIRAGHVIIAGHLDGDIVAEGSVEILASARIVGAVSGKAIAVAEGAVVEGQMMTTGHAEPTEFVEKRQAVE